MTYEEMITAAEKLGAEAGQAAGTWIVDGNTDAATAHRILTGIEDGDPEILDSLSTSPLSGEWADAPLPRDVLSELGIGEDDDAADDALSAYEDGYSRGVEDQVTWAARGVLGLNASRVGETDIWMTPARAVKVGNTFSTDGAVVTSAAVSEDGETVTLTAVCHGAEKVGTFAADDTLPIWRPQTRCGCTWAGMRYRPDGSALDCGCGWGELCTADTPGADHA